MVNQRRAPCKWLLRPVNESAGRRLGAVLTAWRSLLTHRRRLSFTAGAGTEIDMRVLGFD